MKKLILICFIILSISFISGLCNESQININSATVIELDDIKWVGSAVAEDIISKRPFSSLDELINVSYINEDRLQEIKDQGLACVNGYEEPPEEPPIEEPDEDVEEIDDKGTTSVDDANGDLDGDLNNNNESLGGGGGDGGGLTPTPEVIKLNPSTPKDIKSEDDKKVLDKEKIAKYGFIGFCILIGVLLVLRNNKKQKNNENKEY